MIEYSFRPRDRVCYQKFKFLISQPKHVLGTQKNPLIALFSILGGSSAQFRFRDEEDWEETTDASSTTNSFLVMNLDDLQKSLTCLPLYQRLDIDKDLFSVSIPHLLEIRMFKIT